MPFVRVSMLTGRTKEQKAELAQAITEAVARIAGAKPEQTMVMFEEVERDCWASGGVLICDKQG